MAKRTFSMTDDKKANFTNYAEDRLQTCRDALRVLGNCGNRAQYDPTEAQIRVIELTLLADVKAAVARLRTGDGPAVQRVSLRGAEDAK